MKLHVCEHVQASEPAELAEVKFLVEKLGLNSWAAVTSVYARFFPACALGPDLRDKVESFFMPMSRRHSVPQP
jgi:hypothetical protein